MNNSKNDDQNKSWIIIVSVILPILVLSFFSLAICFFLRYRNTNQNKYKVAREGESTVKV